MFSLCLLPVVTLGLGTVTKCFVLKAFHLQVIKLRALPFPHTVSVPRELWQKHSVFSDDWGVSDLPWKQQRAGSRKWAYTDGPKMWWASHSGAGAKEENQSSSLKRLIFRSTSLPVTSYISQNPHSQTAEAGKDQHESYALFYKILPSGIVPR